MEKSKILFVDDELDFLEVMTMRIESWGYEVMVAPNGMEVIQILKERHPDIVLLDYWMPDMDGMRLLKEIRKINKKIPVVMFTDYPYTVIDGAEEMGVSAFVPKFNSNFDIQTALKKALDMVDKKISGKL